MHSDKNSIHKCWLVIFQTGSLPNVCQDIWHALHRIDMLLDIRHPDYYSASRRLSEVFQVLTTESDESFEQLLRQWALDFAMVNTCCSLDDTIRTLANSQAQSRARLARQKVFIYPTNRMTAVHERKPFLSTSMSYIMSQ